jgi:hypothetical protein
MIEEMAQEYIKAKDHSPIEPFFKDKSPPPVYEVPSKDKPKMGSLLSSSRE